MEEEKKEEGGGSGGSVGLDLTNDVEAHSSRSPVTPRIAGQAGQYHHVQRKSLSGKDFRVGHSLLAWIYIENSGLSQVALRRHLKTWKRPASGQIPGFFGTVQTQTALYA